MKDNNTKASVREVYSLIDELRKEINSRFDKLEENHIHALYGKIENLEKKVYYAFGITTGLNFAINIYIAFFVK